jgi:ethanolamine utilization protein EutQ (cupin superfamily)
MQGGVLKLERGDPLKFTHWYEGLAFVLDGEFRMSYKNESASGLERSRVNVTAGQSLHIPRGMEITYESMADTSYLYFAILTPTMEQQALNRSQKEMKLTIKQRAMDIYPNISLFNNTQKSLSYLVDMLVAGYGQRDNLVGGLYKLLKGPALDYTYEYEEFKYIVSGEFILTDGTGQKVSAKAGDLMYFPVGCAVHFTSPNYALGFFVGQRKWGTA